MKSTRKFLVLCLIIATGLLLQASSTMADEAAPQITVKSKSDLAPGTSFVFVVNSALNTATGENLVQWQFDSCCVGNFVKGRIVNAKGKATSKKLATITQDHYQMGNSVAYNPVKNEYLVVYPNLESIYGQKINSKLKRIGSEFEIIPATSGKTNLYPHLLFNPKTNGYALVWERTDGIAAASLDQSGKVSGSSVLLYPNPGSSGFYDDSDCRTCGSEGRIFDAKFLPSGKLLVIFQQRFNDNAGDYFLATLDADLRSLKIVKFNKNTVDFTNSPHHIGRYGYLATLAVLPDGSARIYYADHVKVNRRIINSKGKLGKSAPAFSGPLKTTALWDPAVTFGTTADGKTVGLLIASQDEPASDNVKAVWGQVLDGAGKPQGEPVLLETLDGFVYSLGSDLVALKPPASAATLPFVYIQSQAARIGFGQYSSSLIKYDLEVQP